MTRRSPPRSATTGCKNKSAIEFKSVEFHYQEDEDEEPQPISRELASRLSAVQGLRWLDPREPESPRVLTDRAILRTDSGKIMLDGQDVTEFSRKSLREQLGYVERGRTGSSGSIRDNLRWVGRRHRRGAGRGSGTGKPKGSIGSRHQGLDARLAKTASCSREERAAPRHCSRTLGKASDSAA